MVSLLVVGALAFFANEGAVASAPESVLASEAPAAEAVAVPPAQGAVPAPAVEPPPTDDPGILRPLEEGRDGVVVLVNGRTYEGHVVVTSGGTVSIRLATGDVAVVNLDRIRGMFDVDVPYRSLPRDGPPVVRVVLVDGSVLGGRLVKRGTDRVVLESAGSLRDLPYGRVSRVIALREASRPIRADVRYLAAPSAFTLPAGDVQIAAAEMVDLAMSAGITDHLALTVGSVVPAFHAEPYGGNGSAALRGSVSVGDLLHVAAGAHLSLSNGARTAAYLSATVTVGTPAANLTVHAGPTFGGANQLARFGDLGVAVCGSVRTPWGFDLVAENWASRRLGRVDALLALAGRLRFGRTAIDGGALTTTWRGEVLPWLGIAVDATP